MASRADGAALFEPAAAFGFALATGVVSLDVQVAAGHIAPVAGGSGQTEGVGKFEIVGNRLRLRGKLAGLSRLTVVAGVVLTICTALFVSTGHFAFACAIGAVLSAATTMHGISAQTLIQSGTSGPMLGRALSLWGMVGRAGPALGALIYGTVAELGGLRWPVVAGCVVALGACFYAWTRRGQMARALER